MGSDSEMSINERTISPLCQFPPSDAPYPVVPRSVLLQATAATVHGVWSVQ